MANSAYDYTLKIGIEAPDITKLSQDIDNIFNKQHTLKVDTAGLTQQIQTAINNVKFTPGIGNSGGSGKGKGRGNSLYNSLYTSTQKTYQEMAKRSLNAYDKSINTEAYKRQYDRLNEIQKAMKKNQDDYKAAYPKGGLNKDSDKYREYLAESKNLQKEFMQISKDLSSGKYDKVNSKGKFLEDTFNQLQNIKKITDDTDGVKKFIQSLHPEGTVEFGNISKDMTQISYAVKDGEGNNTKYSASIDTVNNGLRELAVSQNSVTSSFNATKGILSGYVGQMLSLGSAMKVLKEGFEVVKEFDSGMTTISMTMNMTNGQLNDLQQNIVNTAKATGTSLSQALDVSKIYANMDTSASEILKLTTPTIELANASGIDTGTVSGYIQSVIQQFDLTTDEAEHIADVYENVSANIKLDFAEGIKDIAEGVSAAGNLVHESGMSFETFSSIIAKTAETTRQSGSQIGRSWGTILTRISKASNVSDEIDPETLSKASESLAKIGVQVYDSKGNFNDIDDILGSLAEKWDGLSDAMQAEISFNVAATRNRNTLATALKNYTEIQQMATNAMNADGTAAANQEKFMDTYQAKINVAKDELGELGLNFLDSDLFKVPIDAFNDVLEVINKVIEATGTLGKAFAAFAAMKGIFKLGDLLDVKSIGNIESAFSGIVQSIAGFAVVHPLIASAAASLTLFGLASASAKRDLEEAVSTAKNAGNEFEQSFNNISDTLIDVEGLRDLKTALDEGTLSEEEAYDAKSKLFDIQQQLTDSYGKQAQDIDLVNGKLDDQIEKINKIAQTEASEFLNENRQGIAEAEKQMTKTLKNGLFGDSYSLGSYMNGSEEAKDLDRIIAKYSDYLETSSDGIETYVYFKGNATDAKEVLNDFMTDVSDAQRKFDKDDRYVFDGFLDNSAAALGDAKEIINGYGDLYRQAQQAKLVEDPLKYGNDKKTVLQWAKDYEEAINNVNKALSSGDDKSISSAITEFDKLDQTISGLVSGDMADYKSQFDDIRDGLNDVGIAQNDFRKSLEDYQDAGNEISKLGSELKDLGLDKIDFLNAYNTDGVQKGEEVINAIAAKADEAHIPVETLANMLVDLGIISGTSAAEGVDELTDSLASFQKVSQEIDKSLGTANTLQSILMGNEIGEDGKIKKSSTPYLSESTVKGLVEANEQYASVMYDTASGMMLDTQKASELVKQQQELNLAMVEAQHATDKLSYEENKRQMLELAGSAEELNRILEERPTGDQYDEIYGLEEANQGLQSQIEHWQLLSSEIRGAISLLSQYEAAQSTANASDSYNEITSGKEAADQLYEQGWTTKDDFTSYALLLAKNGATIEEAVQSYAANSERFSKYLTEDTSGLYNFLDDAVAKSKELGEEFVTVGEDGKYAFNIDNMNEFADSMEMNTEMAENFMLALKDAGFNVDLSMIGDSFAESVEGIDASAFNAGQQVQNMIDRMNRLAQSGVDVRDGIQPMVDVLSQMSANGADVSSFVSQLNELGALNGFHIDPVTLEVTTVTDTSELDAAKERAEEEVTEKVTQEVDSSQVDAAIEKAEEPLTKTVNVQQVSTGSDTPVETESTNTVTTDFVVGQNDVEPMLDKIENENGKDFTINIVATGKEILDSWNSLTDSSDIDKNFNVNSSGGEDVSVLHTAWLDLTNSADSIDKDINVENEQATSAIYTVRDELISLNSEEANPDIGADDNASSKIDSVQSSLNTLDADSANPSLNAVDNASSAISSVSSSLDALNGKTATTYINVVQSGSSEGGHTGSFGGPKASGTMTSIGRAHASGTAYNVLNYKDLSSAFASGNVSLKHDEDALVNELSTGPESIVRDGRWMLLPGGPHVEHLKAGDIVFSAAQTKMLLGRGRTSGYGRQIGNAYADGTAYNMMHAYYNSSVTGGSTNLIKRPGQELGSSVAGSARETTQAVKGLGKAAKAATTATEAEAKEKKHSIEAFDWVERGLKVFSDKIQAVANKITKYVDNATKTRLLKKELDMVDKQIENQQLAQNTYANKYNELKRNGYQYYYTPTDASGKSKKGSTQQMMKVKLTAEQLDRIENGFGSLLLEDLDTSTDEGKGIAAAIKEMMRLKDAEIEATNAAQDLVNKHHELFEEWMDSKLEKYTEKLDELNKEYDLLDKKYSASSKYETVAIKQGVGSGAEGVNSLLDQKTQKANQIAEQSQKAADEAAEIYENAKKAEEKLKATLDENNITAESLKDQGKALAEILKELITVEQQKALENGEMVTLDTEGMSDYQRISYDQYSNMQSSMSKFMMAQTDTETARKKSVAAQQQAQEDLIAAQEEATKNAIEKIENAIEYAEKTLSLFEYAVDSLEDYLDRADALGHVSSKALYEGQIKYLQKEKEVYEAGAAAGQAELNAAVAAGDIAQGTKEWYDMVAKINDQKLQAQKIDTEILKLVKKIREVEWERWDRQHEMIQRMNEEASLYINLLSDAKMYDDEGVITKEGLTTMGLLAQEYDTYMKQSLQYAEEMKELQADMAAEPLNADLIDKYNELQDAQRDAIQNAQDQKRAIRDLIEDGINAEIKSLDDLIEKYERALTSQKD